MRTSKQIIASIVSVCAAAGKIQVRIHNIALECLQHAEAHGDCTLFQRLYNELPNGQRREALVEWAHSFSPVRLRQKGEVCKLAKPDAKDYVPFDLEQAAENPYWTQDERTMFKLDNATLDPRAIAIAGFKQKLKKIDQAIEKDANENEPYRLDFDPDAAKADINRQAAEWGLNLQAN